MENKWTPTGRPRTGNYFKGNCSRHGNIRLLRVGCIVYCTHKDANSKCKVIITEKSPNPLYKPKVTSSGFYT